LFENFAKFIDILPKFAFLLNEDVFFLVNMDEIIFIVALASTTIVIGLRWLGQKLRIKSLLHILIFLKWYQSLDSSAALKRLPNFYELLSTLVMAYLIPMKHETWSIIVAVIIENWM
jgi:uncharacterized membrane protein YciS (DUF1049 family)